jgi:hypothetical protein
MGAAHYPGTCADFYLVADCPETGIEAIRIRANPACADAFCIDKQAGI